MPGTLFLMARSALVTGGAGFIGSHLVERLRHRVWVVDNLSTGRAKNLAAAADHEVEFLHRHLRDQRVPRR